MKKCIHVVPHQSGWAVKSSPKGSIVTKAATQKAAIEAACKLIQEKSAELIIHSRLGVIRERRSFGVGPTRESQSASGVQALRTRRKSNVAGGGGRQFVPEEEISEVEATLMNAAALSAARLLIR